MTIFRIPRSRCAPITPRFWSSRQKRSGPLPSRKKNSHGCGIWRPMWRKPRRGCARARRIFAPIFPAPPGNWIPWRPPTGRMRWRVSAPTRRILKLCWPGRMMRSGRSISCSARVNATRPCLLCALPNRLWTRPRNATALFPTSKILSIGLSPS